MSGLVHLDNGFKSSADVMSASNERISLRREFVWSSLTNDSYLVDPASSYMLVSKIKPCKSKYKSLYDETADGSLKQLSFI